MATSSATTASRTEIVAATVTAPDHLALTTALKARPAVLELELTGCTITTAGGLRLPFHLATGHLAQLLSGEEDITRTLRDQDAVAAYESRVAGAAPWLQGMD